MIRTVFFGTPDFAVTCLNGILESDAIQVAAVVSAPDRPSGRGQQLKSSPVALRAQELGIPLLQPERLRDEAFLKDLSAIQADVFTVVAFRMLPESVWNMPRWGSLNIHGSLLPDLRGAAPIQWSLAYGDAQTGVTAFSLNHAIDEGPVIDQMPLPVGPNETLGELYGRMAHAGAQLATQVLEEMGSHGLRAVPQPSASVHRPAPKLTSEFAHLEGFTSLWMLHNRIRACDPSPGASLPSPERTEDRWKLFASRWSGSPTSNSDHPIRYVISNEGITLVSGDQSAQILEVQWPGKRRMPTADFVRGSRLRGLFTLSGQKID